MEQRRDLYMIFKEAVNNLAKYSCATNAGITLQTITQHIAMKIADDGKGFNMTGTSSGNGLHNMKQRAEKWNGNLQVQTSTGRGTTILLNMPLAK
jgi:signal transduction histidine kinase